MTPSLIDQAAKHAATELERGADWCSAPVGTALFFAMQDAPAAKTAA